jgi:hypothetical protein
MFDKQQQQQLLNESTQFNDVEQQQPLPWESKKTNPPGDFWPQDTLA